MMERQRKNIIKTLEFSPSLNQYLEGILEENYQLARRFAAIETDLSIDIFPSKPFFSIKQILENSSYDNEILKMDNLPNLNLNQNGEK